MKIKANSWHFRLVREFDSEVAHAAKWESLDSCTYIRAVMKCLLATFLVLFIICLVTVIGVFALGSFIAWIFAMMTFGYIEPDGGALIVSILLASTGLVGIGKLLGKIHLPSNVDVPFLREAYTSTKNKFCTKVDIEYENGD